MNEQETLICLAVGAVALFAGYHLGMRKALEAAQRASDTGAQAGSGAFAMDWFATWGKGP